jgi:prevent-host-death family protein
MDRAISASEANQRFSELLREVAEGESFTVTSRGRPVARVVPVDRAGKKQAVKTLVERLRRLPVRHSGPWSRGDLYE